MKLYTVAHGAKVSGPLTALELVPTYHWQTTNLIINLDHDEWILDDDSKILAELGFGNAVVLILADIY